MNALILAAGFGSRLMPLTQSVPKCMVCYQNKPIIDYELQALTQAGVRNIAVVGGYLFDVLKEYLSKHYSIEHFYSNPKYSSTNMVATLFCAREFLRECQNKGEDVIISYADIIYSQAIVEQLRDYKGDLGIIIDKDWKNLWSRRFKNPLEDAETLKLKGDSIIELGKKPLSYSDIQGQYIGLFKFSSAFIDEILSFYDSLDKNAIYDGKDFNNMYMTSFLQLLIDKYQNAKAVFIHGGWCEIDFKSDLEIDIFKH